LVAQFFEARLEMRGNRIVDFASNLLFSQVSHQFITPGAPDNELIVDMPRMRHLVGQCNRLYPAQTLAIEGRVPPPAFSPSIQILQLDSKHGGLNFVQTEIAPELLAVVLCPKSMASQEPHARGEIGIICGDHAAVTEPAQIFGGIETEAARVPNGTGAF